LFLFVKKLTFKVQVTKYLALRVIALKVIYLLFLMIEERGNSLFFNRVYVWSLYLILKGGALLFVVINKSKLKEVIVF